MDVGTSFSSSVKSPLGLVLYCYFNMPTINKTYLIFSPIFFNSYEADFIQGLLEKTEKKLARSFNVTFRYIDHVFSLNNSKCSDFVDTSTLYLDLHLKIDSARRSITKLYDIRDDVNFLIVNFPFICSNIPATHVYMEYIFLS